MEEPEILIVNDDIILKPIMLSDAPMIFNTIDTQRSYLGKWLPFVAFTKKVENTRAYIRTLLEMPVEIEEAVYTIRYKGNFAGLIGLKDTDSQNKKTEIGYWLSEPFQKKGIMTESVKALMNYAFNTLNFNRVQIKCAVGNTLSSNIPKRLGFHFEGIERDGELLTGGKFTDIEVYSKLKRD